MLPTPATLFSIQLAPLFAVEGVALFDSSTRADCILNRTNWINSLSDQLLPHGRTWDRLTYSCYSLASTPPCLMSSNQVQIPTKLSCPKLRCQHKTRKVWERGSGRCWGLWQQPHLLHIRGIKPVLIVRSGIRIYIPAV